MRRLFEDAQGNRIEVSARPALGGAQSVDVLRDGALTREEVRVRRAPDGAWLLEVGGITRTVYLSADQTECWLTALRARDPRSHTVRLSRVEPPRANHGHAFPHEHLRSPMTGRVVVVHVAPGDHVAQGQPLLVVEAMKMEHVIRSPRAGVVLRLACAPGRQVEGGAELVELEPEDK